MQLIGEDRDILPGVLERLCSDEREEAAEHVSQVNLSVRCSVECSDVRVSALFLDVRMFSMPKSKSETHELGPRSLKLSTTRAAVVNSC